MSPYLKAIFATVLMFLGTLDAATLDGPMTLHKWLVVATATIVAGGTVWGVPNLPSPPKP